MYASWKSCKASANSRKFHCGVSGFPAVAMTAFHDVGPPSSRVCIITPVSPCFHVDAVGSTSSAAYSPICWCVDGLR